MYRENSNDRIQKSVGVYREICIVKGRRPRDFAWKPPVRLQEWGFQSCIIQLSTSVRPELSRLSGYQFGNLESCEAGDKLRAVFYWLGDSYPAESNLCFEYAKMLSLINMKQECHECRHDDNEFHGRIRLRLARHSRGKCWNADIRFDQDKREISISLPWILTFNPYFARVRVLSFSFLFMLQWYNKGMNLKVFNIWNSLCTLVSLCIVSESLLRGPLYDQWRCY